ncbi:MAG: AsmA family protein [Geminicoccaceae bacterium]
MRKFLTTLLLIVVLLVVAVVAAPFVLPTSFVKGQIESLASRALGRKLVIAGDLDYTLLPPLTVHATSVSLANREGDAYATMASFDELTLAVDALAWFQDRIDIGTLTLVKPTAHLSVNESGVPNWQFYPDAQKGDERERGGHGGGKMPRLVVGNIRIEDGTVTYDDRVQGIKREFGGIRLTIAGATDSPAIDINGSVEQGGQTASVEGKVADAGKLAEGGASDVELAFDLPGGKASMKGNLDAGAHAVDLKTVVDLTDLRGLASWAGKPLDLPDGTLKTVSIDADVKSGPDHVDISGLKASVDDLSAQGDLSIALGDRPKVTGTLSLAAMDLTPYLPAKKMDSGGKGDDSAARASSGWPADPLDLPLPLPVDMDLTVDHAGLKADPLDLGAGKLHLLADASHAGVEVSDQTLYDGTLAVNLDVVGSESPDMKADIKASGIDMLPLLKSVAQFERLAGKGDLQVEVASKGDSVRALMQGLAGKGQIMFRDGALIGINIGALMREILTLGVSSSAGEARNTDFAELGGTFTIDKGILDNRDLALRAPLLRLNGAGTVDLPDQKLDYAIEPEVASTLQGQDAKSEPDFRAGIPVAITGPWADPSVQLKINGILSGNVLEPGGLTSAVSSLAKDPAAVENLGKKLESIVGGGSEKGLGNVVEGLFGTDTSNGTPASGSAGAAMAPADGAGSGSKVGDKLINSLGNLLGKN